MTSAHQNGSIPTEETIILAFDTATDAVVVALSDEAGRLIAGVVREDVRAQAVLSIASDVMREAGVRREAITSIAVGIGPGSFTGLRVGVATARGLAATLGVGLRPIPSLAAVAAGHAGEGRTGDEVVADIDARRGERFQQRFRRTEAGTMIALGEMHTVAATSTEAAADEHSGDAQPVVITGPARPVGLTRAAALVTPVDYRTIVPFYGRDPDATPSQDARPGKAR